MSIKMCPKSYIANITGSYIGFHQSHFVVISTLRIDENDRRSDVLHFRRPMYDNAWEPIIEKI